MTTARGIAGQASLPGSMSLVSVIITANGQSRYLGQAIDSVLGQTYPDLEAIVVDAGSTDAAGEIVRLYRDTRLRYQVQENAGTSAARNAGMRAAWGRYLTFLDSDDLFLPDKLDVLVRAMTFDQELGLVAGQAIPIDEIGRPVGKWFDRGLPSDGSELLLGNPLHVGSVLLRRSWQEKAGGFDEGLRSYEDWDLWLRMARVGCRMSSVAQPVSLHRFRSTPMTVDGNIKMAADLAVLDKVFATPALPESWRRRKEQAYSGAYLRAAANAYLTGEVAAAQKHLSQAIDLQPTLQNDGGRGLADRFSAWTDLPKTSDPVTFLETIYRHLPPRLGSLRRRRNEELGRLTLRRALDSYRVGDRARTLSALRRLVRYRPAWFARRGVASMFFHSFLSIDN